ncbi:MAG: Ig-like domain-containing protein, partial [Holophagales bacterium]|nr:Ig-like domain-containing protein [Holophagales bacterium]
MKNRLALAAPLAVLCACLYVAGCDSASNPVAPGGSVVTVTANPTVIPLTGGRSTITISGFRPDGNPLNPGTQVNVSTSLGRLLRADGSAANVVEVSEGGFATVFLNSDGRQGTATITVSLTTGGEGGSATVDVQVGLGDTDRPTVTVDANPTDIAVNETSIITVTARNPDNTPLGGATVNLRTSLGTLSFPNGTTTGSDGRLRAELTSSQSGTATVTASAGASEEVSVDVAIGTDTRRPEVTLTA